MMPELTLLLKATVVLSLGLMAAAAARRATAAMRALVHGVVLVLLLLLPIAPLVVPARTVAMPVPLVADTGGWTLPDIETWRLPATAAGTAVDNRSSFDFLDGAAIARGIWAIGVVVLLARLVRALARMRHLRRTALPWDAGARLVEDLARQAGVANRGVRVLLTAALPAPITCGSVRPVIVLPADAARWTYDDLRQALLHEMEHVRRRDSLVHLLAGIACAVYWIHPLAWMAWRRLRLESERACDDAVVRTAERTAYAAQLVTLARRLTAVSPRPLLSMAAPSDLATRVRAVLDSSVRREPMRATAAAAILALAAIVLIVLSPLQAAVPSEHPQGPSLPPAGELRFGVVSVRPADPADRSRGFGFTLETGRLRLRNQTVRTIVSVAYAQPFGLWFPDERISGGPDWMNEERYTIEARAERAVAAAEMGAMLRSLLADRFDLQVRLEPRERPVYALVLARRDGRLGPELRRSDGMCAPRCGIGGGPGRQQLSGATLPLFAGALTELVGRPVIDRTGLEGPFDGTLSWASMPGELGPLGAPAAPEFGASLFTALEEQLGLKLQSERGPVDFLIVERLERPRPN